MAADNLLLIHSRIGTLDIYVVAAMVWAVALYLRGRALWAGVVLGVGACAKLVAPYALPVLVLIEGGRWLAARRGMQEQLSGRAAARRLGICAAAGVGVFFALLAAMDRIAPPYNFDARKLVG